MNEKDSRHVGFLATQGGTLSSLQVLSLGDGGFGVKHVFLRDYGSWNRRG